MKKKNKKFLHAEDAQSTVIGFVLIMGIVLSASTIYFASQVPEWTKDYESRHTAGVSDDFSELKTVIEGIKGAAFERTTTIKMSPDKVPILGMSPPGSNLIVNPQAEKFEVIIPVGSGGGGSGNWTMPDAAHGNFTDYYDADNSNKVDVSFYEVKLLTVSAEDLILDEEYRALPGGIYYYDQFIIKNESTLVVNPASGVLKIYANNITVDSSSKIDANGCGAPGGDAEKGGCGAGYGNPGTGESGGGGAGYGGKGGNGGADAGSGGTGGVAYGDNTSLAITMGSGGGGGASGFGGRGGTGGGGIWLDAEEITIDGTISANGEPGKKGSGEMYECAGGGGGGGSGGGILIRGKDVNISGELFAKGGKGRDGYKFNPFGGGGGGGSGGRIKVFHESALSDPDWSVAKGTGGYLGEDGGDGSTAKIPGMYEAIPPGITYYSSGYFVSTVYDTGNDSVFYGEMTWDATLNGQDLVMKVRTDWNESMAYATHWDDCPELSSKNGENEIELLDVNSVSPAAHRYIQFRAEWSTDDDTETPVLTRFKVNYSFSAPAQTPILANATGSIKFNSNYLYYPNQEIVYEHGAVIKYQREGGFMLQSPSITINNKSGIPAIQISLLDLTGANYSYSSATTTSVKNTFTNYNLLADCLKYPNLTINVTTDYPSVWGNWFNKKFEETTLTTPHDYNVSVNATAKTVSVDLYGHEQGVELYLEKTEVVVEI